LRAYREVGMISSNIPTDMISECDTLTDHSDLDSMLTYKNWLVLYGGWGFPAAVDIESKFIEAALGQVSLSDYRNFAHGRHNWLAKHGEQTCVICLITPEDEIANKTIDLIPNHIPLIKISTSHQGPSGALDLVVKVVYFTKMVGDAKGIDPGKPSVQAFGRKLYHLKIHPSYIKEDIFRAIKPKEEIAIKRKLDNYNYLDSELVAVYQEGYKEFTSKLNGTHFGSVVFDYDGTLCDSSERFNGGPSKDICKKIVHLLKGNIPIGIATGRGKSIRFDLQQSLPKEYWDRIIIGYYNGSNVALLSDNSVPAKNVNPHPTLRDICNLLDSNELFKRIARYELRSKQVTIFPHKIYMIDELKRLLVSVISLDDWSKVKMLESSHSVDIVLTETSKNELLLSLEKVAMQLNRPRYILCIGDRGNWLGNDYELLSTPYSLSVDLTSADLDSCWNLAPAGHRGVQATLNYINSMIIRDRCFKFSSNLTRRGK
ncbi:MAG: HAD hydrolase family protein, partial [Promethearchaeota archaeon]